MLIWQSKYKQDARWQIIHTKCFMSGDSYKGAQRIAGVRATRDMIVPIFRRDAITFHLSSWVGVTVYPINIYTVLLWFVLSCLYLYSSVAPHHVFKHILQHCCTGTGVIVPDSHQGISCSLSTTVDWMPGKNIHFDSLKKCQCQTCFIPHKSDVPSSTEWHAQHQASN